MFDYLLRWTRTKTVARRRARRRRHFCMYYLGPKLGLGLRVRYPKVTYKRDSGSPNVIFTVLHIEVNVNFLFIIQMRIQKYKKKNSKGTGGPASSLPA